MPGILIAFASGTAALLTENDDLEDHLAVPMGVGMGLTFDEAALLLDLRDVYWTREGLLSVQLSLGATAILSIAILTQRMLRRGERQQEEEGLIPPAADHLATNSGALAETAVGPSVRRASPQRRMFRGGDHPLWFRCQSGIDAARARTLT